MSGFKVYPVKQKNTSLTLGIKTKNMLKYQMIVKRSASKRTETDQICAERINKKQRGTEQHT